MKLLEVYRAILRFSGLVADDNGYISVNLTDKLTPAIVNGCRLVLPTDERLHNSSGEEQTVFHPLTENIRLGESDVIKYLKQCINVRLNLTTGHIVQSLLTLVASPNLHSNLSPEQAGLLAAVRDSDEKAALNLVNIMVSNASTHSDRLFTNIYLKRGAVYKGTKYSRVGIVGFPFYADLLADKVDPKIKLRVKDKAIYKDIFEYVFTDIADAEGYNYGSNSITAPFLEALLRSAAIMATRFNDLLALYSDYIDDYQKYHFDCSWIDALDNVESLMREINSTPPQAGNEGSLPEQLQQPARPAYLNQVQQPQYQVNPPPPPEIKRSKKGIDFRSLVASNPGLAAVPNALGNQLMAQAQRDQVAAYNAMVQRSGMAYPPAAYPPGTVPNGYTPGMYAAPPGMPYPPAMPQGMGYPQPGYPPGPQPGMPYPPPGYPPGYYPGR